MHAVPVTLTNRQVRASRIVTNDALVSCWQRATLTRCSAGAAARVRSTSSVTQHRQRVGRQPGQVVPLELRQRRDGGEPRRRERVLVVAHARHAAQPRQARESQCGLMERLCALVPKPRKHLVTYHGVLAPASGLRPKVVPRQLVEEGEAGGCRHGAGGEGEVLESAEVAVGKAVENVAVAALRRQQAERRVRARLRVPHGGGRRRGGRRRYSWAELLQRALPRPSSSGLLRRPGRQRTQRRAAHVRDRGADVPLAEAVRAEKAAPWKARLAELPPAR